MGRRVRTATLRALNAKYFKALVGEKSILSCCCRGRTALGRGSADPRSPSAKPRAPISAGARAMRAYTVSVLTGVREPPSESALVKRNFLRLCILRYTR
jgi:hypothetical protein